MSLTNSPSWMYSSGAAFYDYEIEQSGRFQGDTGSANYFRRNLSINRQKWTCSFWIKRSDDSRSHRIMESLDNQTSAGNYMGFLFQGDGKFHVFDYSSGYRIRLTTAARFRDLGAWYHFVVRFDSTQSTASNRVRLYVNGVHIPFVDYTTYPSQNLSGQFGNGTSHYWGRYPLNQNSAINGYMADVILADGQSYGPEEFGETKSGIWVPKDPSITYGSGGFRIQFANASSMGTDTSGNGNSWTSYNWNTYDQVQDSPTNNFNTLAGNVYKNTGASSLYEGGLLSTSVVGGSSNQGPSSGYSVFSGKWYFEVRITGGSEPRSIFAGPAYARTNNSLRHTYLMVNIYDGLIYVDGSINQSGLTKPASGDIFGFAVDVDNATCQIYRNGSTYGTQKSFSGSSYVNNAFTGFQHGHGSSSSNSSVMLNYGQDSTFAGATTAGGNADDNGYGDFKYAPPSGFLAMCSQNLPEPTFSPLNDDLPEDYFNTVLYTGNGGTQNVTGVGFQPDFVWIKNRSNSSYTHQLIDVVRGKIGSASSYARLRTDTTSSEATPSGDDGLTTLSSDGFTVLGDESYNNNGNGFNSWNWKLGGTPVTNTDGSVTTTVSANADAGVSIVGYSGSGTTSTFGHGLGTPVDCMIVKRRNGSTNWIFKHKDLANGTTSGYMQFDTTTGRLDDPNAGLTGTNDTTFTISNSYGTQNASGGTYVAYCFAGREGFSSFGKYQANNSDNGPFVYLGFKPAFLIIRSTASARDWLLYDNKLHTYNNEHGPFQPNTTGTPYSTSPDGTYTKVDFLATGFKLRVGSPNMNWDSATFVYMAFAEQPFKYANAE